MLKSQLSQPLHRAHAGILALLRASSSWGLLSFSPLYNPAFLPSARLGLGSLLVPPLFLPSLSDPKETLNKPHSVPVAPPRASPSTPYPTSPASLSYINLSFWSCCLLVLGSSLGPLLLVPGPLSSLLLLSTPMALFRLNLKRHLWLFSPSCLQ